MRKRKTNFENTIFDLKAHFAFSLNAVFKYIPSLGNSVDPDQLTSSDQDPQRFFIYVSDEISPFELLEIRSR